jgi:hypothetical protein
MHELESHTHAPPWQVHVLGSFRSTHWFVASSHTSLHVDVNHRHDRFATVHFPPGFKVLFWRAAAHACRRRCRAVLVLERRFRTSSNIAPRRGDDSAADVVVEIKLSAGASTAVAADIDRAAAKAKKMMCLAFNMVKSRRCSSCAVGLFCGCFRRAIVTTVRKSRRSDRGVSFGRQASCILVCSDGTHIDRRRDWAYVDGRNASGAYFVVLDRRQKKRLWKLLYGFVRVRA